MCNVCKSLTQEKNCSWSLKTLLTLSISLLVPHFPHETKLKSKNKNAHQYQLLPKISQCWRWRTLGFSSSLSSSSSPLQVQFPDLDPHPFLDYDSISFLFCIFSILIMIMRSWSFRVLTFLIGFFMHAWMIKRLMIDWLDIWDLDRLNFLIPFWVFAVSFRSRFVRFWVCVEFFCFKRLHGVWIFELFDGLIEFLSCLYCFRKRNLTLLW